MTHAATWMNFRNMLSERKQTEKTTARNFVKRTKQETLEGKKQISNS